MSGDLNKLLSHYKIAAQTPREAATYFENLTVDFLKDDPGMAQQFETAWPYSQWAAEQGIDKRDTGIDVVANCCVIPGSSLRKSTVRFSK
jgi:predicted helicase